MKRFGIKHISSKLFLAFILCIMIPLLLSNMFLYGKIQSLIGRNLHTYTENSLMLLRKDMDAFNEACNLKMVDLYEREKLFQVLKEVENGDIEILQAEAEIKNELYGFLIFQDSFQELYLIDARNNTYYANRKREPKDVALRAFFDENPVIRENIVQNDGAGVWFSMYDDETGKRAICLGRVVKDIYSDFRQSGLAVAVINDEHVRDICSDIYIPQYASFYILDNENQIIFNRNGKQGIDSYIHHNDIQVSDAIEYADLSGSRYGVVSDMSQSNGWKYVEFIEEKELASDSFQVRSYFIFTIVISVFFLLIVSLLLSHYMSEPIKGLVRGMERIKEGDIETPLIVKTEDEIGMLCGKFNEMRTQINKLISDVKTVSEKEKEAEIQALKAQFDPHFLYNALAAINWLAVKNNQEEISGMIANLSDILRYSLDRNTGDIVTLREDMRWVRAYLTFQKKRFDNKFDVIFNIDPSVLDYKVHKLLIQPLLENSIIHGFEDTEENGLIIVNIHDTGDGIYFEIADNGKGMEIESLEKLMTGGKLGIKNVHEKLKLYYSEGYGLHIESRPGEGMRTYFTIPYIS